jgi:hypothetical protein
MYPVREPHKIVCTYLQERHFQLNGKPFSDIHKGIDISNINHIDRTLVACCDCECVDDKDNYDDSKRWIAGGGNTTGNRDVFKAIIDGEVFYFSYYHTEKNNCSVGQKFKKGDVVGYYGNVGMSTGPHVHLQAWDANWKVIDPSFLLDI